MGQRELSCCNSQLAKPKAWLFFKCICRRWREDLWLQVDAWTDTCRRYCISCLKKQRMPISPKQPIPVQLHKQSKEGERTAILARSHMGSFQSITWAFSLLRASASQMKCKWEEDKSCHFQMAREKGTESFLSFGSKTPIYITWVKKPTWIPPDHNRQGRTVISFNRHRMQQLRGLSVKGRQMENGEDLLQSVLLPERADFVPQWWLKSMRGQGCQIPQGRRADWRTGAAGDNISQYLISSYEVKCKHFQLTDLVCSGLLPGIQPCSPASSGNKATSSCNTCSHLGFSY